MFPCCRVVHLEDGQGTGADIENPNVESVVNPTLGRFLTRN